MSNTTIIDPRTNADDQANAALAVAAFMAGAGRPNLGWWYLASDLDDTLVLATEYTEGGDVRGVGYAIRLQQNVSKCGCVDTDVIMATEQYGGEILGRRSRTTRDCRDHQVC